MAATNAHEIAQRILRAGGGGGQTLLQRPVPIQNPKAIRLLNRKPSAGAGVRSPAHAAGRTQGRGAVPPEFAQAQGKEGTPKEGISMAKMYKKPYKFGVHASFIQPQIYRHFSRWTHMHDWCQDAIAYIECH